MKAPAADNRAELLDRALELFAAYGYEGVGVQQICDAAAVTKPTLYHYFGSKRGLLETLIDERLRILLSSLTRPAAQPEDIAAALERAASAMFVFARSHSSFYRLYLALWFAPMRSEAHEIASKFHALHFQALERICREAMQELAGNKNRRRAFTAAFLGALNNRIGLALNDYASLDGKLARGLVRQFLYGVLARPEAGRHDDIPDGKGQS
jgi:TetR/AcrR family transcriptional regulator